MAGRIAPGSKSESVQRWFFLFSFTCSMKPSDQFAMVFLFGILGAAMLAKPTITKVEKMIGLIHKVGI